MFSSIKNQLKGLGKSSKSPTSDLFSSGKNDAISIHKHKRRFKQTTANELAKWTKIRDTMGEKYDASKSKDFMTRYEVMKGMIKDAITDCERAEKMKTPAKGEEPMAAGGGKIGRLTAACKTFADNEEEIANEEEYYAGKSNKELEMENKKMDVEVSHIKREIDIIKTKFTELSREYEASKNLNPKQRYDRLKVLIKGMYREEKK